MATSVPRELEKSYLYSPIAEKRSSRKPISRMLYRTRNRGRYSLFLSILV
jgi:hypothetical protein